jgi:hypothetical protein
MVKPMSNKGPVQQEMESLLAAAFPDANFTLSNDSASHHGHMGDDVGSMLPPWDNCWTGPKPWSAAPFRSLPRHAMR